MEKKIVYVAYDGKEFSTEQACIKYELSINAHPFKKDFSLYDDYDRPIPHDVSWGDEIISYIRIIRPSEKLNMYLEKRFKDCEIYSPWADGGLEFKDDLYFWDKDYSCWRSWSDEMEKLDMMGEYFQMFTEN